jgi:hypothetical protein
MPSRNNLQRYRPSMTKTVGYEFMTESETIDLEPETESFFEKEVQRKGTPVTQFGTDGHILWMNGRPGRELRLVLKRLILLGWIRKPYSRPAGTSVYPIQSL